MAKKQFRIAFNAIATVLFTQFIKLIWTFPADRKYYGKVVIAGIVSLILEPFRWIENLFFSKKLAKTKLPESPVFILGHWRSGTTLLHNVMCQDDQFAFVSTYQGVFTGVHFTGRWLFKPFMKLLIPEKRPGDNVTLSPDVPQEEEIALGNIRSFGFYYFWFFPRQWKILYEKYIRCTSISGGEYQSYKARYKKLIAQSLIEHQKTEFISKNPPNTGRIKTLLEMFPEAKFVYIYRNPVWVYLSTIHFFAATLAALKLQDFSEEKLEKMVFELYENIITDYEEMKSLIPENHIIEIRYEDFIRNPIGHLHSIYSRLGLKEFDSARNAFETYISAQNQFEKNTYDIDASLIARISQRLDFAMRKYGYAELHHI